MPSHAYKVVRIENGRYLSTNPSLPDELCCEYRLGEWIEAPVGGLLLFPTCARAKNYSIGRELGEEILYCEVAGPVKLPFSRTNGKYLNFYRRLWEDQDDPAFVWLPWPEGTLAFKRVKPLRLAK